MFQVDLGLALDFLICVALYGLVRLVRGSGLAQRLTSASFGDLLVAPRSRADVVKHNSQKHNSQSDDQFVCRADLLASVPRDAQSDQRGAAE